MENVISSEAPSWIHHCDQRAAWLSLDKGDNDPVLFLTYFIAALQTIRPGIGESILAALRAPQPPPIEPSLTLLIKIRDLGLSLISVNRVAG